MPDKNIGFNRNVKLDWLDAIASYVSVMDDQVEIRKQLEAIMPNVDGAETKRKNIDILVNIWLKSKDVSPALYAEAKDLFKEIHTPLDRIWLHYGLTLIYYPYFREIAMLIGQINRHEDQFTKIKVKEKLISSRGELGSMERSLRYVLSSMKDWGVLSNGKTQHSYIANRRKFQTDNQKLQAWLLACSLFAHPASQLPFEDLLRLPELFPFQFTIGLDILRNIPKFSVYRQGSGLNMVEHIG
jgi:hypothetical protein